MAKKASNPEMWRRQISARVAPETMKGIDLYAKKNNLVTHTGKSNVGRIVDILWEKFCKSGECDAPPAKAGGF